MFSLILIVLVLCFGLVVFWGAPYLPSKREAIIAALNLAEFKKGQMLIELGCGDGRVLIAAAKAGGRAVGYELNPVLALVAFIRTRRFRGRIKVIWGNYLKQDWPKTNLIFVFSNQQQIGKVNNKITQYKHRPVKLASYVFELPGKETTDQKSGVYLYNFR